MPSQNAFPPRSNGEAMPKNGKAKVSLGHLLRLCPWRRGPPIGFKSKEEDDDSSDSASPTVRTRSALSPFTASACAPTKGPSQVIFGPGSFSSGACLSAPFLEDQHLEGESKASLGSGTRAVCEDAKDPTDHRLLGRIRHAVSSMHHYLKLHKPVDWKDVLDERLDAVFMEEPEVPPPTGQTQRLVPSKAACKPPKVAEATAWRADTAKAPKETWRRLDSRANCLRTDTAVSSSCQERLPLKVSENSWLCQQQARRALQSSTADETRTDEEICRKMKGILNKLTVEKFFELSSQLVSCGIRTSSHLEMLIQEVSEKATMQHHFINMYADLCVLLHTYFAENPNTHDPETDFKKILSTACQLSFEKHHAPPVSLKTLEGEELAQGEQLYKTRMLGNIRFIGALLVRKMLASQVMFAIMGELLAVPTAEALESLAALLTVVGPTFDVPELPNRNMLTGIFDKVKELCKKVETSVRVRCLLQDVLDLQASSWKDGKVKKLERPSTLEQVAETFRTETAAAHTGPMQRSVMHNRHQSGFQGAPARVRAGIDAGGDVKLAQSVTHERPQSSLQGGRGEEPSQKNHKMPPVLLGAGEELAPKNCKQRHRDKNATIVSTGDPIKDSLVGKIKCLQRSDKDFKQAWGTFCGTQEGNARDPVRYPVDVLERFLQDHCPSDLSIEQNGSGQRLASVSGTTLQSTGSASPNSQENEPSDQKSDDKPERPKMMWKEFLRSTVRKELAGILAELRLSHAVEEAVSRVAALDVPGLLQKEEICEFLGRVAKEGSEAVRKAGFDLIVNLFDKGHWEPAALGSGLQIFIDDVYADLKMDVPALPKILCEELCPVLQPLVKRGWLTANHLKALAAI